MKIAAATTTTTTTTTNRIDLGNPPKKKSINLVVLKRFWDPRWPWRFLGLQSLREAKLIGRRSESFGREGLYSVQWGNKETVSLYTWFYT